MQRLSFGPRQGPSDPFLGLLYGHCRKDFIFLLKSLD
jgi:hypothetical protein